MKNILKTAFIIFCLNQSLIFSSGISVLGSLQGYISTDFNSESYISEPRPFEVFNNKKGQIGLNDAGLGIKIDGNNYYGKISLQFGDYGNIFNPVEKNYIQEMFAGYNLTDNLSVEGGYFLSNKVLNIFNPENQNFSSQVWNVYTMPFNHAGIKLNYKIKKEFRFSVSALNSVNDTKTRTGNLAMGADINYRNDFVEINYNGIYGREVYEFYELFHNYHNFSVNFSITKDLELGAEINNFGVEAMPVKKATARTMNTLTINASYIIIDGLSVAGRFAMTDNNDILFGLPQKISNDIALAVQYNPSKKSFVRFEVRNIVLDGNFRDDFLLNGDTPTNNRTDISINFGYYFDRLLIEVE